MKRFFSTVIIGGCMTVVAAMLAGCSTQGQQSRADQTVEQAYGTTTQIRNITSAKGYAPTEEDVARYRNNIVDFLEASVPNFNRYRNAMIVVDDVPWDSLSGIALSDVARISVMDSAPAVALGSRAAYGAILIRLK